VRVSISEQREFWPSLEEERGEDTKEGEEEEDEEKEEEWEKEQEMGEGKEGNGLGRKQSFLDTSLNFARRMSMKITGSRGKGGELLTPGS
jgi:hypothetical protein